MLQKSARFAMAAILAASLCPLPAYAADNASSWESEIPSMVSAGGYVEGQAIVGIDPTVERPFDLLKMIFGSALDNTEEIMEIDGASIDGIDTSAKTIQLSLVTKQNTSTEQLLRDLADEPSVVFAEPNYQLVLADDEDSDAYYYEDESRDTALPAGIDYSSTAGETEDLVSSPDDFTDRQWAYSTPEGVNPPQWNQAGGNMAGDPVVVAVLDSGIDTTHPDLATSLYRFSDSQKSALNCSESGYDALGAEGSAIDDISNHGTKAAGVIGAAWNGVGVSGLASNSRLISVRVADSSGNGTVATGLRGYNFVRKAVTVGVPVSIANASWSMAGESRAIDAVVRDLGSNQQVLSVFAAGNGGSDRDSAVRLSRNANSLVVAASTPEGTLAPSSSYGSVSVDLAAPGTDILTTSSSSYRGVVNGSDYLTTEESGDYIMASGSSLAAAAVSGAAAVLAAEYRDTYGNLPATFELARLVASHTRASDSLAGVVHAGGVLDLSSPHAVFFTTQATGDPVITDVMIDDELVTIDGENFGDFEGDVYVTQGGLSGSGADLDLNGEPDWSDTMVEFTLKDKPSGVIDIEIVTEDGASVTTTAFVSAGKNVYETEYDLPEALLDAVPTASSPMMPGSLLVAGDGCLFYLPETSDGAGSYRYRTVERFDIASGTWDSVDTSYLIDGFDFEFCSATMYDGQLVVYGTTPTVGDGTAEVKVYVYNPEFDDWDDSATTDGAPLAAGIVAADDTLLLVGGTVATGEPLDTVCEYSLDFGVEDPDYATLETPVISPKLAYHDGDVYIYSYGDSLAEWNSTTPAGQHFQILSDGYADAADDALPAIAPISAADTASGTPARALLYGSIAPSANGLFLVGPTGDGESADTHLLEWNDAYFEPYGKWLSDVQSYGAGAAVTGGKLYGVAASRIAQPYDYGVFRATAVSSDPTPTPSAPTTIRVTPSTWTQGSPGVVLAVYSPELSRFAQRVTLDGRTLVAGNSYLASADGSNTVITLTQGLLSSLSVGAHTLVAYFDNGTSSATAVFAVQATNPDNPPDPQDDNPTPANPGTNTNSGGSSGSASANSGTKSGSNGGALAMTGDTLPVVPIAIVAALAAGVIVVFIRKKLV